MSQYLTSSQKETESLGKNLAKKIIGKKTIIGLTGELGGGKTTFIKGLAKGLGIKAKILSPSFVIYRRYKTKKGGNFYHFDCYRTKGEKELLALDFKDVISDPTSIVAIEWAGRIKKIMPRDTLWINFEHIDKKKRKISTWGNV